MAETQTLPRTTPEQGAPEQPVPFRVTVIAGGAAGTAVDVALFPLDTIKTRLQSAEGFFKSGGFRGVYRGLLSAAAGSAPTAAVFFITYEGIKDLAKAHEPLLFHGTPSSMQLAGVHMFAASVGETASCLLRVPVDNVKQKLQAGLYHRTRDALRGVSRHGVRGFYDGFLSTLWREIPFVLIQFPMYEWFKVLWGDARECPPTPFEASICGGVSGAVAGAFTTPMDVVKTRIILGKDRAGVPYTKILDTLKRVYGEGGVRVLFSGCAPRVVWMTIGGVFYFGAYESVKHLLLAEDDGDDGQSGFFGLSSSSSSER